MTEDEAYEEIEERLGIQALRLSSKPKDLILEKVYIDESTREAQMEFSYNGNIFTVYENKQASDSTFKTEMDGVEVDSIDAFHLNQTVSIVQIDRGDGKIAYATQFEQNNAYYYINGNIELETFEEILNGLFFESV